MTQLQFYRKVRSLVWRRNMAESLDKLESEIKDYMLEKGSNRMVIAGYSVELVAGKLQLEKLPVINLKQLRFNFLRKERDAYVVQNKNAQKLAGLGNCVSQGQNLQG